MWPWNRRECTGNRSSTSWRRVRDSAGERAPVSQRGGRKTDIKDCQWIAQLLQHGLLKGSFIPPRPQRELRDLTRQWAQITDERSRTSNRIQKVLEDANVKLGSVASNVVGVSGRLMLEAIIEGQEDPAKLANLAQRSLRSKIPQLE